MGRTRAHSSRFVLLLALTLFAACGSFPRADPADLVLLGGRVFTGDPDLPWAEAVAVRGELIVAVGTDEAVRRRIHASTRVIPLEGRIVVPGINDAAVREPWEWLPAFRVEIPQDASVDELLRLLRNAHTRAPDGSWIRGQLPVKLRDAVVGRTHLDIAAPLHPVRLDLGPYAALLNSSALLAWEIGEREEDPPGGRYGRIVTGALDGWVFASPILAADARSAEEMSDATLTTAMRDFKERALRWGITSAQMVTTLRPRRVERLLSEIEPSIRWRMIQLRTSPSDTTRDGRAAKVVLDGTLLERGAALLRPYSDATEERGELSIPEEGIGHIVHEAGGSEAQLLVHAGGDASASSLLSAMDRVDDADWPGRRLRLESADLLTARQLEAVARLGIVVVQNPAKFTTPAIVAQRVGRDRRGGYGRLRSILDSHAPLALGSDGMLNPWLNVLSAATHPANPAEAITREEAVRAYTRGSAFAELEEKRKGTIAPGMLADFAVLSQDPFTVPLADLARTTSILTVVGGEIMWEEERTAAEQEDRDE
ncbi:MAG: amidohydrolase [Thermoanaerobaculia bacterium]